MNDPVNQIDPEGRMALALSLTLGSSQGSYMRGNKAYADTRAGAIVGAKLGSAVAKDVLVKTGLIVALCVGADYAFDTILEFSRGKGKIKHRDLTPEDILDVPPGGDYTDPLQKMPNWKKWGPWGVGALILWLIAENLDGCDEVPENHPR